MTRVVLVQMPWGAIDMPSLALGILHSAADRAGHEVGVRYANLDFVDWAVPRCGLTMDDYTYFCEGSYFQGAGDWAFAGALAPDRQADGAGRYFEYLAANGATERERALVRRIRAAAPGFVADLTAELAAARPDVVGFTTTFQQNTASLAAARLLKQRLPGVRIVFGGANCDGPQGAALHRNFPFLDYVVRGEGEAAFPALLDALAAAGPGRAPDPAALAAVPGLCWRRPATAPGGPATAPGGPGSATVGSTAVGPGAAPTAPGADAVSVANPMPTRPLPPAAILSPRFDTFFDRLDASAAAGWVEPKLVLEGSRGCWWGEKHHCTFCGLNGTSMEFRSKRPQDFLDEILAFTERHRLLDVYVVDNILDMDYFGSVLRPLSELPVDLRLHFEVKANLRRHQFQLLADSGAVQVQPGIESLSTHVLRIMDKGVTGCQNVRALRDAQSAGVSVTWNYLYGFPGETVQDYESVIGQLPLLHHLDPPSGAGRIVIERFSPYYDKPELGFDITRPAFQYRATYDLPEGELADLAYVFTAPLRGIGAGPADELVAAVDAWRAGYPGSRLSYLDLGERIVLVNSRAAYGWQTLELTDPAELALFRLLDQPRSMSALAARTPGGQAVAGPLVERWSALGLLFHDQDTWIQVAVESDNQMLMRVEHRHPPTAADEPPTAGDTPGEPSSREPAAGEVRDAVTAR